MSLLGGGGHKTCAAAQLDGVALNKAKEMLLSIIGGNEKANDIKKSKNKKPSN